LRRFGHDAVDSSPDLLRTPRYSPNVPLILVGRVCSFSHPLTVCCVLRTKVKPHAGYSTVDPLLYVEVPLDFTPLERYALAHRSSQSWKQGRTNTGREKTKEKHRRQLGLF
jgi:hypothetical protein